MIIPPAMIEIAAVAVLFLLALLAVMIGVALLRRMMSLIKSLLTCLALFIVGALIIGVGVAIYLEAIPL